MCSLRGKLFIAPGAIAIVKMLATIGSVLKQSTTNKGAANRKANKEERP